MKTYYGRWKMSGAQVVVREGRNERPLDPRFDLMKHSPGGFAWGYAGSGPSQLALALCADALGEDARALAIYQAFKRDFVAALTQDQPWSITEAAVKARVHELEQGEVAA